MHPGQDDNRDGPDPSRAPGEAGIVSRIDLR